ncbi:MAG: hypothetical protein EHM14_12495 [Methanothrix sp.]|nr:MAG: hypothetical protein EHM14_12495 [Methanothrix sp.]
MRLPLVAAVGIACWLILAGFPAAGYNSLNGSSEDILSLNVAASEGIHAGLAQEIGDNYSAYLEKISSDSAGNETLAGDVADSAAICNGQLWIVDYWGNRHPCDGKCVFMDDIVRMIVIPCKRGLLKLYERNPDGNVIESRYIPVSANRRYSWYFVGDTEGLHDLWFTLTDRYRQVSQSNQVTFRVMIENCSPIANCSPTYR